MMQELLKEKVQAEEEITITELLENLDMEIWESGIDLFKVTESFAKKGKDVHMVRYLRAEEEMRMVFFSDLDNIIRDTSMVINLFLKSSVIRVSKSISNETDMNVYKIQFKDGYVLIECLLS